MDRKAPRRRAAVWWRLIKNSVTNFAEFKEAFTNKYWNDMIQEKYKKEVLHEGLQIEEEGLVGLHKKLSSPTKSKQGGNQGIPKEGQQRATNRHGMTKVKVITDDGKDGTDERSTTTVVSKEREETTLSAWSDTTSQTPLRNDTETTRNPTQHLSLIHI